MHVQTNHKKWISNAFICKAVQHCLSFQTVGIDSAAVYPLSLSQLFFLSLILDMHTNTGD